MYVYKLDQEKGKNWLEQFGFELEKKDLLNKLKRKKVGKRGNFPLLFVLASSLFVLLSKSPILQQLHHFLSSLDRSFSLFLSGKKKKKYGTSFIASRFQVSSNRRRTCFLLFETKDKWQEN